MTQRDIEIAVAKYFNSRMNIIVPNVSWGLFNHFPCMEVDLLILRPSGWAEEIEIKTNAADIKRDLNKGRHRISGIGNLCLIRRRYFAVPDDLVNDPAIPSNVGILAVNDNMRIYLKRVAPLNKMARKLTTEERIKLMRLGCMRIWTLKEHLNRKAKVAEEK